MREHGGINNWDVEITKATSKREYGLICVRHYTIGYKRRTRQDRYDWNVRKSTQGTERCTILYLK